MVTSGFAASAWCPGHSGVARSIEQATAGLEAGRAGLVLIFPDCSLAAEDVARQACGAAGDTPVVGMTSDGLLTDSGMRPAGCSALALGPEVVARTGVAYGVSDDSFAAGRAAAARAMEQADATHRHAVLLLFLDPVHGDEGEVIDGAYDIVGGSIPLAGGGANGATTALFADGRAHRDAVVAIALTSPRPIGVGIGHACRPLAVPTLVTRSDGQVVQELDGRPAEQVYLERLGVAAGELDDERFERLAALHPLAQPSLRGDLRLRHVRGRAGGGLVCSARIPPNAAVWIAQQTEQRVVESTGAAVEEAVARAGGRARAALVFDCAARRRTLGDQVDDEAEALVRAFGDVPLTGLFTRGEAGRTRGAKGDRNHAVVVVAFG
jgi:hypothetical protein